MIISQALIMAAGQATRMRPLTDNLPKPLLKVGGEPLLTHIIDHLLAENVTKIIINGYHAITPLKAYIDGIKKKYPQCDFILSEETELLETGGGAVLASKYINPDEPFYMINGDAFWINPVNSRSLKDMSDAWNPQTHDILLLLQNANIMHITQTVGDYTLNKNHSVRSIEKKGTHMFTGVRLCMPSILKNYDVQKFSFLTIMDDIQSNHRLGGIEHHGEWYHISTPQDLNDVNQLLYGAAP